MYSKSVICCCCITTVVNISLAYLLYGFWFHLLSLLALMHCHPLLLDQSVQLTKSSLPSVSPTFGRQLEQSLQAHYISFQEHPCCWLACCYCCWPKRVQPTRHKVSVYCLASMPTELRTKGHSSVSLKVETKVVSSWFFTISCTSMDAQVTDGNVFIDFENYWVSNQDPVE